MDKLIALATDGALQKKGKIVLSVLFASGEKSLHPRLSCLFQKEGSRYELVVLSPLWFNGGTDQDLQSYSCLCP